MASAASLVVTEHTLKTKRHTTFYLAAGPKDGPLVIFCHGWPELSTSWRHSLPVLAALGFRAVAPDMRGYGRSSVYNTPEAYAQQHVVEDMLELLHGLGRERAVWVGHDWGSPVVWNIASHHPSACAGVVGLCIPYWTLERGLDHTIQTTVDRTLYPEDAFPAGQWEYMKFYEEKFSAAQTQMEMDIPKTIKTIFRSGDPEAVKWQAATAFTRIQGGWFGGQGNAAPDYPRDPAVVSAADMNAYVSALERHGFFGPNAWYVNHAANERYASAAVQEGQLKMPVLFIAAEYDGVCPPSMMKAGMTSKCSNLKIASIKCGHWVAQEKPIEFNSTLVQWLARELPAYWPGGNGFRSSKL